MNKITIAQVAKSYNGRSGCMCGCLGKYSLAHADQIEAANKDIGYEGFKIEDVRPKSVATAVRKVNAAIERFNGKDHTAKDVWFAMTKEWVSIDENGRNTTVYLKQN